MAEEKEQTPQEKRIEELRPRKGEERCTNCLNYHNGETSHEGCSKGLMRQKTQTETTNYDKTKEVQVTNLVRPIDLPCSGWKWEEGHA